METRGANCAKFRNREFEDLLLSVPIVMFQPFYGRIKLANKEPATTWQRQYVCAFDDFILYRIINLFCTCASNLYGNFFISELEKRIPLTAQTPYCAELEELQDLLYFPEEVALRLADTEYQLFYQVRNIRLRFY